MNRMKKVYICAPLKAYTDQNGIWRTVDDNIKRAEKYCKEAISSGNFPLCGHIYFAKLFNDNISAERQKGLQMDLEWLRESDEVWVFGGYISEGMQGEIDEAKRLKIPISWHI